MNISGIGPCYGPTYVSGIDARIMQSSEDADKVIAAFENTIRQGYHPESIEQDIYQQLGVNPADFTWYDKERINKRVNEIWASSTAKRY